MMCHSLDKACLVCSYFLHVNSGIGLTCLKRSLTNLIVIGLPINIVILLNGLQTFSSFNTSSHVSVVKSATRLVQLEAQIHISLGLTFVYEKNFWCVW